MLRSHGVAFSRVPLSDPSTVEILNADLGDDILLATTIARDVLTHVFRLPEWRVRLQANDICSTDVVTCSQDRRCATHARLRLRRR